MGTVLVRAAGYGIVNSKGTVLSIATGYGIEYSKRYSIEYSKWVRYWV
jgi:hypothetical protein